MTSANPVSGLPDPFKQELKKIWIWVNSHTARWVLLYYQIAFRSRSNRDLLYQQLGDRFCQQKQFTAAIAALQKSAHFNPNCFETYKKLGNTFAQIDLTHEAISAYKRAVEIKPNGWGVYLKLAHLLALDGKWEESLGAYLKVSQLQKNGELSESQEELEKIHAKLQQQPDDFSPYYKFGTFLTRMEQWESAANAYLKALELNPLHRWWHYSNLWDLLSEVDKLDDAARIYRSKLENSPKPVLARVNFGEILTRQGKIEEAIESYQVASYNQTVRFYPNPPKESWNSEKICAPQFAVIGTQKGGTTSLYYYMTQHPQVLTPIKKEIHFWSSYFELGLDWYLSHFPPTSSEQNFLSGEASTNYFDFDCVPDRMYRFLPQTKLIILLRNPVDRAISHYYHSVREGWEHRSFEDAIERQMQKFDRDCDPWNQQGNYLTRGMYVTFIKKWMEVFPANQLLILNSQDFYENPGNTLTQVFEFLDIPDRKVQDSKKYNAGSYASINPSVYQQLRDYYQPYNRELEDYLGMKFSWE